MITQATLSSNVISNFPSGSGIVINCGNSNSAGPGGNCGTPSTANVVSVTSNTIKGQSAANQIGSNAIAVAVAGGNGGSRSQANFDVSNNGTVANPLTHFKGTGVGCTVLGMSNATCNVTNNVMVANNIVASRCISVGVDRLLAASDLPETCSLASVDVSFISLALILPASKFPSLRRRASTLALRATRCTRVSLGWGIASSRSITRAAASVASSLM